jgi:23S rRNA (guanosine2251-2'-O)-methyltransferase
MPTNLLFQIYECQNIECRLRFPTNISIDHFEKCLLCGSSVVAVGAPFTNQKPKPIVTQPSFTKFHLLLDNLRSTLNVGSIFRTANCAAIDHIFCCGTTPTPLHSKFSKSGLTSEETVSWSYHRNALEIIHDQKDKGFRICSLEVTCQSTSIFNQSHVHKSEKDVLLVVGNEISGIDPGILDLSDSIVYIPMLGTKTSLNVSIAAAIGVYTNRFSLIES